MASVNFVMVAARLLFVVDCIWVGPDLHSCLVALLVLQRSLRTSTAACDCRWHRNLYVRRQQSAIDMDQSGTRVRALSCRTRLHWRMAKCSHLLARSSGQRAGSHGT